MIIEIIIYYCQSIMSLYLYFRSNMILINPVLLSASVILFLDVSYTFCQEHLNIDEIIDPLLSLITSQFFLLQPLESSTPAFRNGHE